MVLEKIEALLAIGKNGVSDLQFSIKGKTLDALVSIGVTLASI